MAGEGPAGVGSWKSLATRQRASRAEAGPRRTALHSSGRVVYLLSLGVFSEESFPCFRRVSQWISLRFVVHDSRTI